MKINNIFIINGDTSNPIGVVRGAGRNFNNLQVHLLSSEKTFVNYSKYVDVNHYVPNWKNQPDDFVKSVENILNKYKNAVVIPTDDSSALIFSKYKKKWLNKDIHVLVSDIETVKMLLDADLFRQKMKEENISTVNSIEVNTHKDIRNYLQAGTKIFIKPVDARAKKDYFILKSTSDYINYHIEKLELSKFIFQKWIDGFNIYMFYVFRDLKGNISYCGYDKIRQYPPYAGSGCFVVTKKRNELIERSIDLLTSLNYIGFAEFEYKFDKNDNKWYLLEINPRTTTQSRISDGSKVDVEVFGIKSCINGFINNVDIDFKEGLKWMLEIDDVLCYFKRKKDKTLNFKDWYKSIKGTSNYGIWASDDLKATFMNYYYWILSKIT